MNKTAKFNVGEQVIHKKQGYRAVIIDVDPLFQASGRYNPQAIKRAFATRNPWYRLLVDKSSLITYVEECLLSKAPNHSTINNPYINHYLDERQGNYYSNARHH
jgi:heat shock protein HspQ